MSESSRAIVLLSAGLDSTVSLALAQARGVVVAQALTFDYGQRAAALEIQRSRELAAHYQIPFEVIELPWLARISQSALSQNTERALPEVPVESLDQVSSVTLESAKQVWVPNRNGVFLNIAASYADQFEYQEILVGFNAEEAATFPDNTPQYAEAASRSLAFSTQVQPRVISEVMHLNKIEIFQAALRLEVPLHLLWSCYRSGPAHCGKCESCSRLIRAAQASGHPEMIQSLFEVNHV